MTQKTKKNSAAKKLVPAAGMLAVSAMMLASSTYAWFTMSREVEVQNIKMTASVPADVQISLGKLSTVAGSGNGLVNNQGTLVPASGTSADNGGVAEPGDVAEYWSNTADVSAYYAMGRLMPASSTTGMNIYFTPDAAGVGKTLKAGAKYYIAATAGEDKTDAFGFSREATAHAYLAGEKDGATIQAANWAGTTVTSGNYTKATDWNKTNDDGYFVDIPVWLRTSCTDADVQLAVDAYVTSNSINDDDEIYLAARAVILDSTYTNSSNILEIRPDSYASPDNYADATKNTIVDYMNTTNGDFEAVNAVEADGSIINSSTTAYANATRYTGGYLGNAFNVPAATAASGTYGTPVKYIIRVWLEGEDPNCWNDNAGQDFNISLKFTRDRMYNSTDTDKPADTAQTYPDAIGFTDNTAVLSGMTTTVSLPTFGGATNLTYTYDGTKWTLTSGKFKAAPLGGKYKIAMDGGPATDLADAAALAAYLKTYINTKALAATNTINISVASLTNPTQVMATSTSAAVTYSVTLPTTGVDHYVVNGVNHATKAALETALEATPGTYTIDIVYTTP
jgi:hypothetical protein